MYGGRVSRTTRFVYAASGNFVSIAYETVSPIVATEGLTLLSIDAPVMKTSALAPVRYVRSPSTVPGMLVPLMPTVFLNFTSAGEPGLMFAT